MTDKFLPKIQDRQSQAKSLGLFMRPSKPVIVNLCIQNISTMWEADIYGYSHANPSYFLYCYREDAKDNAPMDFTIHIQQSNPNSIEMRGSSWFLRHVSTADGQLIINYFIDSILSDLSFKHRGIDMSNLQKKLYKVCQNLWLNLQDDSETT